MAVRGALPYVPCPTLDQQYAQRSVGPTPFSSAKARNADYERPSLALLRPPTSDRPEVLGSRMSYPASLHTTNRSSSAIRESRSVSNIFVAASATSTSADPPRFASPQEQLRMPNTVWDAPPPMLFHSRDLLHREDTLPRDTLHPLISELQAGENAKAAMANPAVAFLANASRKGPPCEAHRVISAELGAGGGGAGGGTGGGIGGGPSRSGEDDEEDYDGDNLASQASRSGPSKAGGAAAYRGDLRTFAGRSFNAVGGIHEPEVYATSVVETASKQPRTLTEMAAKALASALHTRPNFSIPAHVMSSVREKPLPNSGPHGLNVNRHTHTGLNDPTNVVVSPPQAFRNLSAEVKEVLLSRQRDCRHRLAKTLREKHLVFQPPPLQPEPGMLDQPLPKKVVAQQRADDEARRKLLGFNAVVDDPEPLDELSDSETDPVAALGEDSSLGMWLAAVRHCSSRRSIPPGAIPTASHPAHDVVLGRCLKVLTPQLFSLHTSMSNSIQPQACLGGTGIAMGDTQAQMKPPSASSFLSAGTIPVTQYSDLERTPANAFAFDSERLVTLLSDKGQEVEELFLEGCTWLSTSALSAIGRYCVNLKLLNLQDCAQLTDDVLVRIVETCRLLAYVNISGCVNITGVALSALFRCCKDLHALCMSGLPRLSEDDAIAFGEMHHVPHLEVLDVSYCTSLTSSVITSACQYCRSLRLLNISGCQRLSDSAVASIGASLPHIQLLRLRLCTQFSPVALERMAVVCRNLYHLDLGGLTQVTPPVLEAILTCVPRLRHLSLSGCTQVDDRAVSCVTRYCRSLRRLNISSCQGVSMASCMELVHELAQLRWLIVSESSISNAEVVMLSALRESCKIIRNQYRPQPRPTLIAYLAEGAKKKKADDGKGSAKKKK